MFPRLFSISPLRRSLHKHANTVCNRAQRNRAKGSREELPCGVQRQRLWWGSRGETPYAPIFSMTFSVMTEVTKPPGFVGIISREC